ncbi:uncharacterized protein L203_103817 [Cryptococcus depauperatus CBS 7841]|uniref:Uncharacterized protein n=1 Tax=Cryptococcus depauperatus CBS 7841 TaxID=1295531 RepID=A0A1E3IEC2_9TREE|nr:hypothetical protein L203_03682 [Cryptococcus depauperatus CBS 7841]
MSMDNPVDLTDDYEVRPSRIKLKTTKTEKAGKIYRREQRRFCREQERISRANGYALSPPRKRGQSESISPPRNRPRQPPNQYEQEHDQGEWMGGYARRAREEQEEREWEEKIKWMTDEAEHDPFGDYPTFGYAGSSAGVHIPSRWREAAAGPPFPSFGPPFGLFGRMPQTFPQFGHNLHSHYAAGSFPAGVPSLGSMTEEEYTTFIREGLYAKQHASELREAERRRQKMQEREIKREKMREQRERAEAKWRYQQEKEEYERRRQRAEAREAKDRPRRAHSAPAGTNDPARYSARWTSLLDVGGEVEATSLKFSDIPWPINHLLSPQDTINKVTLSNVKAFLQAVSLESREDLKKVVREALRNFHPDRFHSRTLNRVRGDEKELVKEGVEKVCRVLNDLVKEVR